MGMAAIAAHRLGGIIPVGAIFKASVRIGRIGLARARQTSELQAVDEEPKGTLSKYEELEVHPSADRALPISVAQISPNRGR
jgi:hypothetical protein